MCQKLDRGQGKFDMNTRKIALALVFFALVGVIVPLLAASAHEGGPHLRFAHLAPDAPAVDVYINDELTFDGLKYKDVTDYKGVEGHEFMVVVVPAGGKLSDSVTKDPIPLKFEEGDGGFYTVAAVGSLKDATFDVLLLPHDGPKETEGGEHGMEATAEPTESH
jgi:hypothetical protein